MIDAAFDYPSQRSGLQPPAEPMLLDTCVIQNLKTLGDVGEDGQLTDEGERFLLSRFGPTLTEELAALDAMVEVFQRNGAPWVVSESSLIEFERANGAKGHNLRQWWHEWADYFASDLDAGWYPEIDPDGLIIQRGPEVADGQLTLEIAPPLWPLSADCVPAFSPFGDTGDRALVRDAMRAGISTILTTDLKSFWRHRGALYPLGIEIWRPTDLWMTLCHEQAVEVARWRSALNAAR
jgi:hypothetical protein